MKKTYRKSSNGHELSMSHPSVSKRYSLLSGQLIEQYTKRYTTKHQHQLALLSLVFLLSLTTITAALTTTIISSSSASALTYQDNVDLKFVFNPSITISVTDLTIPSLGPGSSSDSNIATVSVSSNASAGYTLSSTVGSTESTSSYYNYGTDLRLSSNDSTNIFTNLGNTTATTLNDIANNQWGYSYISCSDANCNTTTGNWKSGNINITNGTTDGYGGYATTATSITHISTTTPGDSAIQYKIGAKAASTQVAGTYTNVINFIGVANPITTEYTLTYASNESGTTNLPSSTTGTTTDGTFLISSTIPTLPSSDHRSFKGWCTIDNTGHTDSCTDGTNTGSIIQPGKQYVIGTNVTTFTGTVYAVWGSDGPTIADFTYMQDLANLTPAQRQSLIYNMAEEETATLKDKRDNQDYTIAKLKDGNIWMTKNMNIAGGTTLTCDMTDCDDNYTLPSNQGWQSVGQLPASAIKNDNDNNLTDSSQFSQDNYAYVYNSGNATGCGGSGQNTPCFSYYSWDVATLGSGRNISTQNTDAPYSICPKGWRLPTSGQHDGTSPETNWKRGDFYRLLTAYGANLESAYNQSTPTFWNDAGAGTVANFLLSGDYNGSTFYDGGTYGGYWSSTSTNSTLSRYLYFSTGNVSSANHRDRRFGFSVRCLYDSRDITKATYMQEVTPRMAENTPTGTTATLKDARDEKEYTVAKLCMSDASHTTPALNTCDRTMLWMTQNLDFTIGSQGITAADSDLNENLGAEHGYSGSGDSLTWTPNSTANTPATITNHATGNPANSTNWTNNNNLPYWAEGDEYYIYSSGNDNTDNIYSSLTDCIDADHTEAECRHYHVGNYYNWSAAVATNASSSYTDDLYVMPNSICPKGWRLPSGLTGTNGNEIITEFNQLGLANNITANTTTTHNTSSGTFVNTGWGVTNTSFNNFRSTSTNPAGYQAPMYFTRSGRLGGTTLYSYGTDGYLWSSTSQSTSIAYFLEFGSGWFVPASQSGRNNGFPVRCVAR